MKITAAQKNEYNRLLSELQAQKDYAENAINAYNEMVEECREFCNTVSEEIDTNLNDRSECWLESEKGQAASEWLSEWQDVDLEYMEELDCMTTSSAIDTMENLPLESD